MPRGRIAIIIDFSFGFITGEREDVFFDRAAVDGGEFEHLEQGQEVEYELADAPDPQRNMLQARYLRVTDAHVSAKRGGEPPFLRQQGSSHGDTR